MNSLIYFNQGSGGYSNWYCGFQAYAAYTNCLMAPTNGMVSYTNIITANPLLAGKDTGDFRLTRDSPCVSAGIMEDWMNSTLDLDGYPRIDRLSGQVDIGAYEWLSSGVRFSIF